jgi:hypothetical protein
MKIFTLPNWSGVACALLLAVWLAPAHAQRQRPPVPPKDRYWMIQETPQHIYRQVELRYMGVFDRSKDEQEITIMRLRQVMGLSDPKTAEECVETAKLGIGDFFDINRPLFNSADRLWADWDNAVLGLQAEDNQIAFSRLVCLPMQLLDDLDIVGLKYRDVSFVGEGAASDRDIERGYNLVVKRGDMRLDFRYDPKRFFERFEAYGLTPKLKVPNTQPREGWDKSEWNTLIKVLPLGYVSTFPTKARKELKGNESMKDRK